MFEEKYWTDHLEYCSPQSYMIPCNYLTFAPRTTIQVILNKPLKYDNMTRLIGFLELGQNHRNN